MLDGHSTDALIGRIFDGYRVTRFLARGGMGLVYEGVQESLDRPVAIKFLYPHLSDDDSFKERFEREARAAARLSHPNIVRILDFGVEGTLYFMVLDLIHGESLRQILLRNQQMGQAMPVQTAVGITAQVGAALDYAHRNGYIHRDIKPGNVLLQPDGRAFLTDFGVVKVVGLSRLTATGVQIGTPEYMSPEQSTGVGAVSTASDIYSLAIVCYEMLTGQVPFRAETPVALMRLHLTEAPTLPSHVAPGLSPGIDAVMMRALAKEPAERYKTAGEFVAALQSAAGLPLTGPASDVALPLTGTLGGAAFAAASGSPSTATGAASQPASVGGYNYQQPPTVATPYSAQTSYPDSAASVAGAQTPSTPMAGGPPSYATGAPPGGDPPGTPPVAAGAAPERSRSPILWLIVALALGAMVLGFGATFLGARLLGDDDDPTATPELAVVATATGSAATPTESAAGNPTASPTEAAGDLTATSPSGEPTATESGGPVVEDPTATAEPEVTETPEGREVILFSANRGGIHESQIFIMNPDGTEQTHLTPATGHSWGPRISPDGKYFFFSSVARGDHEVHDATGGLSVLGGSGNHDIYLSTTDGSEITNITLTFGSWDNGWSWSPDGQWITFSSDRVGGNWDLYKMSPDGAIVEQLTNDPVSNDGWPSWTPDGQSIVFARGEGDSSEIYIMDADGGNPRPLTNDPDMFDTYPFISPDGTQIVFSSQNQPDFEGDIYVMNIDGSGIERLTSTAALNYAPSWSPDGTKIVFVSDRTGNDDIWIMDADGSNEVRITTDPGEDTTPAWGYIVTPESS